LSSEWNFLNEIAAVIDSSHQTPTYVKSGVPMARVTDVKYGELKLASALQVSVETFESYSRRFKAKPRDIIISRVGSYGNTSWVVDTKFCLGQNVASISPTKIDPRYLYYVLNSPLIDTQIEERVVGSTQKSLSLKAIKELKIPRLAPDEENAVGSFFGSLDDRITLLSETNATLEGIAQALFRSWFVNFDPVCAKQEGRDPDGMDEATAALFPHSFESVAGELVPKGWQKLSFTDTVQVIGGGTPKTTVDEYWNGDIPWFSVVDAPLTTDVFVIATAKKITQSGLAKSSTKVLTEGTTIISARGTVGRLALVGCAMTMNQSCYALRGKSNDSYFTYFSTYRLVESLKRRSHGSVFDTITTETMRGVSVVYPEAPVIDAFERTLAPLMNCMKTNLLQKQSLVGIRDTLLPRLISGQLRLPEAVDQIKRAA
jgi:restriction endonuclease S subunit